MSPIIVAPAILALTYGLVMIDRFDRSVIAMIGGGAMILCGVLDQQQAIRGIDFNTIGLLTGMMVLMAIARRSGIFECLAIFATRLVRASPAGLLAALALVTALLSSLLDNVTTVLLIAPVTLSVTRKLGVPPFPFLFAEVMAANIGGTATLIGDPPNILIGSAAGLSFNDFLIHVAPAIALVLPVQLLAAHLAWGRSVRTDANARAEVLALRPAAAITDRRLLRWVLVVAAFVLLGFTTTRMTGLEPGTIALVGGAALMLLENVVHHREQQNANISATYGEVDWTTIFFFIGLFILVHGVESTGLLDELARLLIGATHGSRGLTVTVILWGSAVISSVIDNIPFVAAMIPVLKAIAPHMGGDAGILPLWVALSLGACLGGNGTLVGASANLTVAGIAQRARIPFGFGQYTIRAAPLTLVALLICQAYLLLRYL